MNKGQNIDNIINLSRAANGIGESKYDLDQMYGKVKVDGDSVEYIEDGLSAYTEKETYSDVIRLHGSTGPRDFIVRSNSKTTTALAKGKTFSLGRYVANQEFKATNGTVIPKGTPRDFAIMQ